MATCDPRYKGLQSLQNISKWQYKNLSFQQRKMHVAKLVSGKEYAYEIEIAKLEVSQTIGKTDQQIRDLVTNIVDKWLLEGNVVPYPSGSKHQVLNGQLADGASKEAYNINVHDVLPADNKKGYRIIYSTTKNNETSSMTIGVDGKRHGGNTTFTIETVNNIYKHFSTKQRNAKKITKSKPRKPEQTKINFDDVGPMFATAEDEKIAFNDKNAERINAELINDPNKAEAILNELLSIDGIKISSEHVTMLKNSLFELTGSMKQVIPDMIQYINKHADKNSGSFMMEGPKKGIRIGVSTAAMIAGNEMSAAERYVHELEHASLEYALKYFAEEIANSIADARSIYEKFISVAVVQDFMPSLTNMGDVDVAKKIAQQRLDYLKNPKNGFHEFLVMAKTNPYVRKILVDKVTVGKKEYNGKGAWGFMVDTISKIYDFVYNSRRKNQHTTGLDAIEKYIAEISLANNSATKDIEENTYHQVSSAVSKFQTWLNKSTKTRIRQVLNKLTPGEKKTEANKKAWEQFNKDMDYIADPANNKTIKGVYLSFKTLVQMIGRWLNSKEIHNKGTFEAWMSIMGYITESIPFVGKTLDPDGDIPELLNVFQKSDSHSTDLELLGVFATKAEAEAESYLNAQAILIDELFNDKLTDIESDAVTKVIVDLNLGSLLKDKEGKDKEMALKTLIDVLNNPKKLDEEILVLESQMDSIGKTSSERKILVEQARGLGEMMVTGNSRSKAQLSNGFMIYGMASLETDSTKIIDRSKDASVYINMIERLASLHGLKHQGDHLNAIAGKVFSKNLESTESLIKYHAMAQLETQEASGSAAYEYEFSHVMGSSDKISSSFMTPKIGKTSDAIKFEEEGYLPVDNNTLTYDNEYTIYINSSSEETGIRNETMDFTNEKQQINSFLNLKKEELLETKDAFNLEKKLAAEKAMKTIMKAKEKEVMEELKRMGEDNYRSTSVGLRPVFSKRGADGKITLADLDISVDKRMLESTIRTKNNIGSVVAKTLARARRLRRGKKTNKTTMDLILKDMNINYLEGNSKHQGGTENKMEYVKIGEFENNKHSKFVWNAMPRYMRDQIKDLHYRQQKKETAELLNDPIFMKVEMTKEITTLEEEIKKIRKRKERSTDDFDKNLKEINTAFMKMNKLKDKLVRAEINKLEDGKDKKEMQLKLKEIAESKPHIAVRTNLVRHYFGNRKPELLSSNIKFIPKKVVRFLKKFDMVWQHIVTVAKVTIVVRDAVVLMFNVLSNIILAMLDGRSPIAEIQGQLKGFIELNRYLRDQKKQVKLKIKAAAGTLTQAEENMMNVYSQNLKENTVHKLIEEGLYTSMSEDIANTSLHKETYVDYQISKMTKYVPNGIKDVFSALWLTKDSQGFNVLLRTMQASDFAARYSAYHRLTKKGPGQKNHREAIKEILDNQINYGWGQGDITQWLQDRGGMLFSKFGEGIVRPLSRILVEKPANILGAILVGGPFLDMGPITDSILARGGPLAYMKNPFDLIETLTDGPFLFDVI